MTATLDTNVLNSGTLFGGRPGKIFDAAIDRRFTLAVSPTIVAEYREVLSRRKFGLSPDGIGILVSDLEAHATMYYPTKSHNVIADDPDDNAILDCAVEANADYIVSGDGHLTDLQEVDGIRIVTPAEFVELIT